MKPGEGRLYKGRDWVTSRLSVAEALDSLDHICDLALYGDEAIDSSAQSKNFAILQALHGLVESLSAQCAIAQADSIPATVSTGTFKHLWVCFEIEQSLLVIKDRLIELSEGQGAQTHGEIAFLAQSLKTSLKRMDQ